MPSRLQDHHDLGSVHYVREAAEQEIDADGNPVLPEK